MKWSNGCRMRLVLVGFVVAFAMVITQDVNADGFWQRKAEMPTPRWALATAVVNGRIYAIGGARSESIGAKLSTVEEYEPATDTWSEKADMPTARQYLSASVVAGKIYAIGGNNGLKTVEQYNPVTDTWTQKRDLLSDRSMPATCVINGTIYVMGGCTWISGQILSTIRGVSTVEMYDPSRNTTTKKASMPQEALWGSSASVLNGKIYTMGGGLSAKPTVFEYDPLLDTWTKKADMITGRRNFSTNVLNGMIYAMGGWQHSNASPYVSVEAYDIATDMWTAINDMPERRATLSTCTVNGKIYAIGGTPTPHPCIATPTLFEYDPNPHIVDFDGDGTVDIKDLFKLTEHWGQNEPAYDLAPIPIGDGIIDAADVEVLMSHWGQALYDPNLLTHWKLDETDGDIAYDSAGENDSAVIGDAIWQPGSGNLMGALQLDGIDDYIQTDFIHEPTKGPLSVFVWIKGGAPGQAIVSQEMAGSTWDSVWLGADPTNGRLATSHLFPMFPRLESDAVITDGQWHRIGLVWDGTYRHLYVDDEEVAIDEEPFQHLNSSGGLHIGADSHLQPSVFWSGLIDDVRIYNRVIMP